MQTKAWSAWETRWIKTHAGDGAAVLATLLERTPRDVIHHGLEVGIDVAPRPELGESCPWCGGRMTDRMTGYRLGGVCDACWYKHLQEAKTSFNRERAEQKAWNADKVARWREAKQHG